MSDETNQSWWQTLPGILTALAGTITALGGLVAVLYQVGIIGHHTPSTDLSISKPATVSNSSEKAGTTEIPTSDHTESATVPSNSDESTPHTNDSAPVNNNAKIQNLLTADNGGHLVVASSDDWLGTIDGKEGLNQISYGIKEHNQAVFGFKDEKSATLEKFTILINETADNNVKEFELFVGNGSPSGPFESIGKFQTTNAKLYKTPYQEFSFTPIKAKFVKIKLLTSYGSDHPNLIEVQLFGILNND